MNSIDQVHALQAEALDYLSDTESFEVSYMCAVTEIPQIFQTAWRQGRCLQILERGCALLGYAPIGSIGMLLLATRLRSAAVLPGGHLIRLVAESRWLQISLLVSALQPKTWFAQSCDAFPSCFPLCGC